MSKIDELLSALKDHELMKRGNRLKQLIEENPSYIEQFQAILEMQKQIVRLEYATGELQVNEKKQYEIKLQELLDSPLISEYLSTVEELNDLVQTLTFIINDNLNATSTE